MSAHNFAHHESAAAARLRALNSPLAPPWFVLSAYAEEFGCAVMEQRFRVEDVELLATVLGEEAKEDPELRAVHWLGDDQVQALISAFGVGATFRADEAVALSRPSTIRAAPYLIHTGFELFLMLEGRKPFAAFANDYPSTWADDYLAPFAPHVAAGRLSMRSFDAPFPEPVANSDGEASLGVRWIYYAQPDQEWRFDAYDAMFARLRAEGWSPELERLQGTLLGYEEWQNDWWADTRGEWWRNSGGKT